MTSSLTSPRRRRQLALLLGPLLLGPLLLGPLLFGSSWLWQRLETRRGHRRAGTASALAGATGLSRAGQPGGDPGTAPALTAAVGAATLPAGLPPPRPPGEERLRRAEERLAAYQRWARYPPDCRPASEQPERLEPTAPLLRAVPLARQGGQSPEVRLQLGQDRVTLVGSESARLSLRCEDSLGALLACSVLTARALPLIPGPTGGAPSRDAPPRPTPAELRFSDDGRSGDEVAGDGILTATLQPARLGFGGYLGPLRVALSLHAQTPASDEGETGEALFDLWYTPEPPAVLTGQVREAIVDGSLHLYLGIDVRTAGHYELAARVDDSRGKSFALLQSQSELAVGPQELTLVVFGKLILDAAPAMPLRLRDVDGFLLRQTDDDAEPDREHLPLLAGYVHTSGSYPPAVFSNREWQGAERDRSEKQLQDELDAARDALCRPRP